MSNSPVIFGSNNVSNNLQSGMLLANGAILAANGTKNYITFGNFENNSTTGWSLGVIGTLTNGLPTGTPTFSSGAAGTLAISTVSTGQLSGSYSLSLASSAATVVGNMLSTQAYAIDVSDQAKVLSFKFSYSPTVGAANANFSGTSANSYAVAVWDVTNASFIGQSANFGMTQSSGVGVCTGSFQTNATTASIRFVIYAANATTGACTILVDDVTVGPQVTAIGAVITDLAIATTNAGATIITATTTNPVKGTTSNDTVRIGRVGDHARIKVEYKQTAAGAGTTGTGDYLFALPNGLSFDSNKVTFFNTVTGGAGPWQMPAGLGSVAVSYSSASSTNAIGVVVPYDATHYRLAVQYGIANGTAGTGGGYVSAGLYPLTLAPLTYTADFDAPIVGWSSNVQMSSDSSTAVIAGAASGATSVAVATGASQYLSLTSVTVDTSGGFSNLGITPRYTAPVTGIYEVSASTSIGASFTQYDLLNLLLYKNGVSFATLGSFQAAATVASFNCFLNGSVILQLNAGDWIAPVGNNGNGTSKPFSNNTFTVKRLSGPAVIAQSESVNASYGLTTGQSVAANAVIKYDTKIKDTHNFFNVTTGLATIPISGQYLLTSFNTASSGTCSLLFYKNGTSVCQFASMNTASSTGGGSISIPLLAGDAVSVVANTAVTLYGSAQTLCNISVIRTGN